MTAATDRLSDGYVPDFDLDLEVGRQGELFVTDLVQMLKDGTGQIEIKRDEMTARTGNVYIEYECRRSGVYVPSGIATTKALIWLFVLPAKVIIAAPVESVRALARSEYATPSARKECVVGSHPTRGVVVPVGRFVQQLYRFDLTVPPQAIQPKREPFTSSA